MTTAIAPLDTTHVELLENGDFPPAPRMAFAMVYGIEALWGYGDRSGEIVGASHIGPIPVRIPAGRTLWNTAPFSRMNGDKIVAAIAMSREDYSGILRAEREQKARNRQGWGESGEF